MLGRHQTRQATGGKGRENHRRLSARHSSSSSQGRNRDHPLFIPRSAAASEQLPAGLASLYIQQRSALSSVDSAEDLLYSDEISDDAPSTSTSHATVDKVGVLLLNLGGPDKLEDVEPFLYNLFADPEIIRLPPSVQFLQPAVAKLISTLRAPKSQEGYKAIGGGSPLRRITEEQGNALEDALVEKGINARVYVGMRYWHPYTEEAMEEIKRDKVTRLVILPLYPQFSISTSGSSFRLLEQLLKSDSSYSTMQHTVIPSWYQRKGYVDAMVDLMSKELNRFREVPKESVEIFFSAHGVPKSYVEEAGDPYKEEMEECVLLIMEEMKRRGFANHHTLAYQSRVGPVEWLQPYTDDR